MRYPHQRYIIKYILIFCSSNIPISFKFFQILLLVVWRDAAQKPLLHLSIGLKLISRVSTRFVFILKLPKCTSTLRTCINFCNRLIRITDSSVYGEVTQRLLRVFSPTPLSSSPFMNERSMLLVSIMGMFHTCKCFFYFRSFLTAKSTHRNIRNINGNLISFFQAQIESASPPIFGRMCCRNRFSVNYLSIGFSSSANGCYRTCKVSLFFTSCTLQYHKKTHE